MVAWINQSAVLINCFLLPDNRYCLPVVWLQYLAISCPRTCCRNIQPEISSSQHEQPAWWTHSKPTMIPLGNTLLGNEVTLSLSATSWHILSPSLPLTPASGFHSLDHLLPEQDHHHHWYHYQFDWCFALHFKSRVTCSFFMLRHHRIWRDFMFTRVSLEILALRKHNSQREVLKNDICQC